VRGGQYALTGFEHKAPIFEALLKPLRGKPGLHFLEVGSFAGDSAEWFLSNILTDESATLVCIDIWNDKPDSRKPELVVPESRQAFDEKTKSFESKVIPVEGLSQEVLREFGLQEFDFVFIDGSHDLADVLTDAVLAFGLLKIGGLLVFDDYEPKMDVFVAVNFFLEAFKKNLEILYQENLVAIRKTV